MSHIALPEPDKTIIARRNEIVGFDLVEVSPDHDPAGVTSILAAQVMLNFLGFVFAARNGRHPPR